METIVKDLLNSLNEFPLIVVYLIFFISASLQITFPPYPGEMVLAFCGFLGSNSMFGGNVPIFLSHFSGSIMFSFLLYRVAGRNAEMFLRNNMISKVFTEERREKAKVWLSKYGILTFIIGKFVPCMNIPTIVFNGIARCRKKCAYLGIFIASLAHDIFFYSIGVVIGDNWTSITKTMKIYNEGILIVLLTMTISYGIYYICRKKQKRINKVAKTNSR